MPSSSVSALFGSVPSSFSLSSGRPSLSESFGSSAGTAGLDSGSFGSVGAGLPSLSLLLTSSPSLVPSPSVSAFFGSVGAPFSPGSTLLPSLSNGFLEPSTSSPSLMPSSSVSALFGSVPSSFSLSSGRPSLSESFGSSAGTAGLDSGSFGSVGSPLFLSPVTSSPSLVPSSSVSAFFGSVGAPFSPGSTLLPSLSNGFLEPSTSSPSLMPSSSVSALFGSVPSSFSLSSDRPSPSVSFTGSTGTLTTTLFSPFASFGRSGSSMVTEIGPSASVPGVTMTLPFSSISAGTSLPFLSFAEILVSSSLFLTSMPVSCFSSVGLTGFTPDSFTTVLVVTTKESDAVTLPSTSSSTRIVCGVSMSAGMSNEHASAPAVSVKPSQAFSSRPRSSRHTTRTGLFSSNTRVTSISAF